MDGLLEKLRGIFHLGIVTNPGYLLGDRARMAIDTHREIGKLPDTNEGEDT
jgi:hypothetical protein